MAKVIELGIFRQIHKACGSLIEFSLSELKEDYHQDYLGERDYYKYIVCPACHEQMKFINYNANYGAF